MNHISILVKFRNGRYLTECQKVTPNALNKAFEAFLIRTKYILVKRLLIFRVMRLQGRIMGIVSSWFQRDYSTKTTLVFVLIRCPDTVESVNFASIDVDGDNSTNTIIETLKSRSFGNIELVLTKGISLGGLNLYDPNAIFNSTGIPAASLSRVPHCKECVEKAIKSLEFRVGKVQEEKLKILNCLETNAVTIKNEKYYVNAAGISQNELVLILSGCFKTGLLPEPLRLAQIIASGLYNSNELFSVHHKV